MLLGVKFSRFFRMLSGNQMVPVREMSMVSGLFVSPGLMLRRGFTMMTGSVFVMFSRHFMMFRAFVFGHSCRPPYDINIPCNS
jgi:hypothetical protein